MVFAPQVGSIVEEGNGYYRITQLGKTAEYYAGGDGPTVSIPDTVRISGKKYKVTSIGNQAFSGKTNLVSVKIGSNVTGIGNEAFAGCVNLKSVVIPAKVRSIGLKAFYGCANLRTVTIRTGKLTAGNIGKKAFAKTGIKTVKTPKGKAKAYRALLRKKRPGKKAKVK